MDNLALVCKLLLQTRPIPTLLRPKPVRGVKCVCVWFVGKHSGAHFTSIDRIGRNVNCYPATPVPSPENMSFDWPRLTGWLDATVPTDSRTLPCEPLNLQRRVYYQLLAMRYASAAQNAEVAAHPNDTV